MSDFKDAVKLARGNLACAFEVNNAAGDNHAERIIHLDSRPGVHISTPHEARQILGLRGPTS